MFNESNAKKDSPKKPIEDQLINAEQVAELLGVSASLVYSGQGITEALTRIKHGRRYLRWSRNEVLSLIEQKIKNAKEEKALRDKPYVEYIADRMPRKPLTRREEGKAIIKHYRNRGR